ncbi:MAG TPA: hypothetical protein VKX16_10105 [Chloroflexota bacterium]|nr:hypothetical protein [Chloroflexota bacterium]
MAEAQRQKPSDIVAQHLAAARTAFDSAEGLPGAVDAALKTHYAVKVAQLQITMAFWNDERDKLGPITSLNMAERQVEAALAAVPEPRARGGLPANISLRLEFALTIVEKSRDRLVEYDPRD